MTVIVTKIEFNPFALSLSKGRSWFDKLTTNGILVHIHYSVVDNRPWLILSEETVSQYSSRCVSTPPCLAFLSPYLIKAV
ncbi:MAG TPA: hypothetical protein VJ441_01115, partial [Dehalococcoidia bacterium]|nr:hypothetical protein [Dehalococcoidia bacterium]